ncbi:hypothetical protein BH10PSE2_BH10PSE2_10750 [soil metagenome]
MTKASAFNATRTLFALVAWIALSLGGCASLDRHAPTAPAGAFAAAPPTGGLVEAWIGAPQEVRAAEVTILYRVWGGSARQLGAWLSPTAPTSGAAVKAAMALPPQNEALFWCAVAVPAGTRMRVGMAAPAFGQPGGGRQVELLELIPASSFGEPHPLAP